MLRIQQSITQWLWLLIIASIAWIRPEITYGGGPLFVWEQVEQAMFDDPTAFVMQQERLAKDSNLDSMKSLGNAWVRLLAGELLKSQDPRDALEKLLLKAKQLDAVDIELDLQRLILKQNVQSAAWSADSLAARYEALWEEAKRRQAPLVRIGVDMAEFYYEANDRTRALRVMAALLENQGPTATWKFEEIYRYQIFRATLLKDQQIEAGLAALKEVQSRATARQMRWAVATLHYREGLYRLTVQEDPQGAQSLLEEGLRRAQSLEDRGLEVEISGALMQVELSLRRPDLARAFGKKALALLQSLGHNSRQAELLKRLSEIDLQQGMAHEAYTHLESAYRLLPDSFVRERSEIAKLQYKVLRQLGRHKDALTALESAWQIDIKRTNNIAEPGLEAALLLKDANLKEQENSRLAQSNAIRRTRHSLWIFSILGGMFALGCIPWIFYLLRKERHEVVSLNHRLTTQILGRFLSPHLIDEFEKGRFSLPNDAELRTITVLSADLCNFTALCERTDPKLIEGLINDFMEQCTRVVFEKDGTLDKFLGDGLIVIYGAPQTLTVVEQARNALDCAVTIRKVMEDINERWQPILQQTLTIRVGIDQGATLFGSFGSTKRMDFTALGPTVQKAERLEKEAPPDCILLTEPIARILEADYRFEPWSHLDGEIVYRLQTTPDEKCA
jgi:class 3 adenylate cyclase